jgi:FLVCR family MFS transporter 7
MAFLYRSSPLIPPAPSGDVEHVPFFRGVLQTIKNLNFWVLLIVWGLAAGTFNALLILIPQYLCPYGYSDVSMVEIFE